MDPVGQCFPFRTPYDISANNPIWFMDWDGLQPVTRNFTHNGQTFTFNTDLDTPQDFSISGESFNFRTRNARRTPQTSLGILDGGHSKVLDANDIDAKVLHFELHRVRVSELLLSVIQQNPDISLAIVGNHAVPTYENTSGNPSDRESRSSLKSTRDNVQYRFDNRSRANEIAWTLDRANFVNEKFFNSSSLIDTYSRGSIAGNNFRGIQLAGFGNDGRGITITFDFKTTIPDSSPEPKNDGPKDPTIYKNTRFL